MKTKRLLWQIFPSFLIITIASLIITGWYTSTALRNFYVDELSKDLETRAYLVESEFNNDLFPQSLTKIDHLCKELGKKGSVRFTFILPSGKVAGDSEENPVYMNNHANRPEIKTAKAGKVGKSIRYSQTLSKNMIYIAVPVKKHNILAGIIRISIPITFIDNVLWHIYLKISFVGLIIALIAAAISLYISKKISRPLEELEDGARNIAKGNFTSPLPSSNIREIKGLEEAMKEMALQLDEKIKKITRQHNEQETVLSNLKDSIIAVDSERNIINMNKAAMHLFKINEIPDKTTKIKHVINDIDLQNFIKMTLLSNEPIENEAVLYGEQFIQSYGIPIHNIEKNNIEAIIVFNDVTHVKKLENIRKDFVANVSHELRTPITSIKGFVETLQNGAINHPYDAERFLTIIAEQVDRLDAIIEDLLSLSRLEQGTEEILLTQYKLYDMINSALRLCEQRILSKSMSINVICDEDIKASINPLLFEQAFVNLITNAINYSDKEKNIEIKVFQTGKEIVISIKDEGYGISKEELPRIFERFYRVDKARSKKVGGTGLGLAIVKHIIQVHHGYLTVDSSQVEGSTFSFIFHNYK